MHISTQRDGSIGNIGRRRSGAERNGRPRPPFVMYVPSSHTPAYSVAQMSGAAVTSISTRATPRAAAFVSPRMRGTAGAARLAGPSSPESNWTAQRSPQLSPTPHSPQKAVSFVQQVAPLPSQPHCSEGAAGSASVQLRRTIRTECLTVSPRKGSNLPMHTERLTMSPRKGMTPLRVHDPNVSGREKADQVDAKAASRAAAVVTLSPRRRLRLGPATAPR